MLEYSEKLEGLRDIGFLVEHHRVGQVGLEGRVEFLDDVAAREQKPADQVFPGVDEDEMAKVLVLEELQEPLR